MDLQPFKLHVAFGAVQVSTVHRAMVNWRNVSTTRIWPDRENSTSSHEHGSHSSQHPVAENHHPGETKPPEPANRWQSEL